MPDWTDSLTKRERREWEAFLDHARTSTLEGITSSAVVLSMAPSDGEPDMKFAVELGLTIMLGKPLVVLVMPGVQVQPKLMAIADWVIEADPDTEEGRAKIGASLATFTKTLAGDSAPDPADG